MIKAQVSQDWCWVVCDIAIVQGARVKTGSYCRLHAAFIQITQPPPQHRSHPYRFTLLRSVRRSHQFCVPPPRIMGPTPHPMGVVLYVWPERNREACTLLEGPRGAADCSYKHSDVK